MVNPEPPALEPELEALLREIARDPRSSLLRFPRPARPLDLARTWEAASRTSPGLTPAERHLLEVHRAETAQFLLDRWLHEVTARPRVGFALSRRSSVDAGVRPDSADLDSRLSCLRERSEAQVDAELGPLLGALDAECTLGTAESSHLLLIAERLQPRVEGKLLVAQDLVVNAQPRSAARLLRTCMRFETRAWMKSLIWHNLGFAVGADGDLRTAMACYAAASSAGEPRVNAIAYWLVLAVQLGDRDEVERAARTMDEVVDPGHALLETFVREQLRTRRDGAWAPTPAARRIQPGVTDRFGPAARRVFDVLD